MNIKKLPERIKRKYDREYTAVYQKKLYASLQNTEYNRLLFQNANIAKGTIASIASYRDRYDGLVFCLKSLLHQRVRAERIIVWLDQDIPENQISQELKRFEDYNVKFYFTSDDLRSHKKYFYALQEFHEQIVLTFDDDLLYPSDTIQSLLNVHQKYPNAVCGRRVHQITYDQNGRTRPYEQWKKEWRHSKRPSNNILITTGSGTLYPPHCMPPETFSIEKIKSLCPAADDLWMHAMERLCGVEAVWVPNMHVRPMMIPGTQQHALSTDPGSFGKDTKTLERLNAAYPGLLDWRADD